jgi:hypothetical protein
VNLRCFARAAAQAWPDRLRELSRARRRHTLRHCVAGRLPTLVTVTSWPGPSPTDVSRPALPIWMTGSRRRVHRIGCQASTLSGSSPSDSSIPQAVIDTPTVGQTCSGRAIASRIRVSQGSTTRWTSSCWPRCNSLRGSIRWCELLAPDQIQTLPLPVQPTTPSHPCRAAQGRSPVPTTRAIVLPGRGAGAA